MSPRKRWFMVDSLFRLWSILSESKTSSVTVTIQKCVWGRRNVWIMLRIYKCRFQVEQCRVFLVAKSVLSFLESATQFHITKYLHNIIKLKSNLMVLLHTFRHINPIFRTFESEIKDENKSLIGKHRFQLDSELLTEESDTNMGFSKNNKSQTIFSAFWYCLRHQISHRRLRTILFFWLPKYLHHYQQQKIQI